MSRVPSITSARVSPAQDLHDRQVRYLISMGIRIVCFAAAVLIDSPWRWAFAIGAVVIPYFAVVLANGGTTRRAAQTPDEVVGPYELPASPTTAQLSDSPDLDTKDVR